MSQLIVFFEDSQGKRQVFRCPEMVEAPRGSLLHEQFDFGKLEVRKRGNGIVFYNNELQDVSASVEVKKGEEGIDITVAITETEIRSFQVFKNIEFTNIKRERVEKGFKMGFERDGEEVACSFSPEDVKKVLE